MIGRSVAFPFDTLKIKLATADPADGLGTILRRTMSEEGIAGFYRGLPFSAFEGGYQKALYVFFAEAWKAGFRNFTGKDVQDVTAIVNVIFGYFSDLQCVPFSMPIEAMVVRLQNAPVNVSQAAIIRETLFTWDGVMTSIKTGKAYLVLSFKPGIEFAIFERLKRKLLVRAGPGVKALSTGTAFFLGALARAIATVCVYPYARGKALSQARICPSASAAVRHVVKTEGVLALYKGLPMELLRGVTQSAVMFAVMERVRALVKSIMLR